MQALLDELPFFLELLVAGLLAGMLASSLVVGDPLLEVIMATRAGIHGIVIWRALLTCSALDLASWPGPSHSESSSPTRTLPPMASDIAAIDIWLRPAPSTLQ